MSSAGMKLVVVSVERRSFRVCCVVAEAVAEMRERCAKRDSPSHSVAMTVTGGGFGSFLALHSRQMSLATANTRQHAV